MKNFACVLLLAATLDARMTSRRKWRQEIESMTPLFGALV